MPASVERCPDCGLLMHIESGCTFCHPKEVKHRKRNIKGSQDIRNEEGLTGANIPAPAGPLFAQSNKERT